MHGDLASTYGLLLSADFVVESIGSEVGSLGKCGGLLWLRLQGGWVTVRLRVEPPLSSHYPEPPGLLITQDHLWILLISCSSYVCACPLPSGTSIHSSYWTMRQRGCLWMLKPKQCLENN